MAVGIVAGAPGAASDLLVGGFTSALPDNAEVVAEAPGMYDPAGARRVAEDMIRSHPDLTYAFVANEQMAFAVRKAFDATGAGQVKIVTVNGTDEGLAALKDGRFSATVANSAARAGRSGGRSRPGPGSEATSGPGPDHRPAWTTSGSPAARHPWKPPTRSVARCRPSRCSESAARLDAYPSLQTTTTRRS
ncbi:hypothetical protein SUDANB105_02010 [Streptomyces sp. enrichment culture]